MNWGFGLVVAGLLTREIAQFANAHTLPFWNFIASLPVVAVAGISIRRVMGFTVMSFLLGVVLFGTALLIFV